MNVLLALARAIDWVTDRFGKLAEWAVILSCFISAGNAVIRKLFDYSSNGWLEIQWYLFAVCVMFGAAHVLRVNEHVRVDVIYGSLKSRVRVFIDIFGLVVFLMPVMAMMTWTSWHLFVGKLTGGMLPGDSIASLGFTPYVWKLLSSGEVSGNAGGLIRWPAALTMPLGFALVLLQGVGEVIKRIGWLAHKYEMDTHYERPLQ